MTSSGGEQPANTVVEIEFRVDDPNYTLAALSAETGCETELLQILPQSGGSYTVFKRINGVSAAEVLDFISDVETVEARVVSESDDETVIEFQISDSEELLVVALIDAGAVPRRLQSANGVVHVAAEIPATHSPTAVSGHLQTIYPSIEMIAQRQKEYRIPLFTQQEVRRAITEVLTSRQHEALVAAYAGGYYEWPREKTGKELAADMGVSPATFSQHLRTAERKLLSSLFH